MKSKIFFASIICLFIFGCTPKSEQNNSSQAELAIPVKLEENEFFPVPMPGTLLSGNVFPTPEETIQGWIRKSEAPQNLELNADIITHGWDIWAALTEFTDQQLEETINNQKVVQPLRRFETWYTPADITTAFGLRSSNAGAELIHVDRHRGIPEKPNQLRMEAEQLTRNVGRAWLLEKIAVMAMGHVKA